MRLHRRSGRKSCVRKVALEKHLKLDNPNTQDAVAIQDAAFHSEFARPMLIDKLPNLIQHAPLGFLCDLIRSHRLLKLGNKPASLNIALRAFEWNMKVEINPFRIRAEPAANLVHF